MTQHERIFNSAGAAAERHDQRTGPKIVSVVVPVKGHPVLIDDAIASVQREIEAGTISRLVVVNDGCTFAETRESLNAWQALLGDRIRVMHSRNGGLSAARNRGIAAAIEADPAVEALFLLDADDMLAAGRITAANPFPDCRQGAGPEGSENADQPFRANCVRGSPAPKNMRLLRSWR